MAAALAVIGLIVGAAIGGISVAAVYERRDTPDDTEQLPERGSAHVDHEPPTTHRAPSRFGDRQVPPDSDGSRP